MKKYTICFMFMLSSFVSMSQVTDDFEDEDLGADPAWYGMLNAFTTVNGELRSNYATNNFLFYMSTASTSNTNAEWRLDCRLMFNTSSVNYVDIMLASDSLNLTKARNGYFVRLGGSADEISLFKTRNGTETKLIDGKDGILNASSSHYLVIVQRFNDSLVLKRIKQGVDIFVEGTIKDTGKWMFSYAGIRIRQSTSSFVNKHFFDNLYIGPVTRDSVAPAWDSLVVVDSRRLKCVFNEVCDSLSLADTGHYLITDNNARPSGITIMKERKSVLLGFSKPFAPNKILSLQLSGISDVAGNILEDQSRDFYDSKPDTPGLYDLLITELMPDPEPPVSLPVVEYVEISNVSGKFIRLAGCRINDPTAYKPLPNIVLPPDSICVLKSIPSLNNAEDRIWISNQRGEVVHQVDYTDAWYHDNAKKTGGYSLEMIDVSKPCIGIDNWKASTDPRGGTPGAVNSVKRLIAADTIAPYVQYYTVENDSTIVLHFSETVDSVSVAKMSFQVNGNVSLFRLKKMNATRDAATWMVPFKPDKQLEYKIGFSGLADCSGNTMGLASLEVQWPSPSTKGQILMNEVLFNPRSGGSDFIELFNNSSLAFDLSKHFLADLDDGGLLKTIYPIAAPGIIVKPGQYVLISEDTANICDFYHCSNSEALKIQISHLPSMPDDQGHIVLLNIRNVYIDSLHYTKDWHFQLIGDQNGVSLERLSFNMPSNSRDNWHSAASTVAYATPGCQNSQFMVPVKQDKYFTVQSKTLSPDEDGFEDVMILRYEVPGADYIANVLIYDVEGRQVRHLVNNMTIGTEGLLTWDGLDGNGQKTPIGIYIIWIECINGNGERIRQKMSVVVAGRL
jgi:hypothetical protein